MNNLNQFTNLYQLSKTLRFELRPVGETLQNIEKRGILDVDTQRAENYKRMKKTIDEYHKSFIERALSGITLEDLDKFAELYEEVKRDKSKEKDFKDCKEKMRKQIVKAFKAQEDFSDLDKKGLIQSRLKQWIDENDPDLYYCNDFYNFTTYFTGYHENRMNMYSDEEKATAVSHRLIDENLPKFIDNNAIFSKISETAVAEKFPQLCSDMGLNVAALADLFSLPYYSHLLTQSGIDAYNVIIGGRKDENTKLQGLNEYINLYNQTHPAAKLPKMKMLYKQILSDRGTISWLPEAFDSASELLDAVSGFAEKCSDTKTESAWLPKLQEVLDELPRCDCNKIYIRSDALGAISNNIFGQYSALAAALGLSDDDEKRKKQDYYALALLQEKLDAYEQTLDELPGYADTCIADHFAQKLPILTDTMQQALQNADGLLHSAHDVNYGLTKDDKAILKSYLDSMMDILHFIKPLYLSSDSGLEQDAVFYGGFTALYEELAPITKLYDKVRNFATKKPYSDEKIKLNFDCSTLLDGWDINKETQNLGVLFQRDGLYYLGIMDKRSNRSFENAPESQTVDAYQKIQYKLLPGPNKMLPKVFFSKSRIGEFAPSDEVMRIYSNGTFKKGENFSLDDCHTLIDFFKSSIAKHSEWSQFGFSFSPTKDYKDISDFYREISDQGYKITYKAIAADYIDSLVRDGKLYLFQIYNKDFSSYSKGKPNLHTMYWKALFDDENLQNVVYKLNGQAEIFYRQKSIAKENEIRHPAGQAIAKKNPALKGQTSTFEYDLIKDKRYTVDKFQFHVPITMNFKAKGMSHINEQVCEYLKNNPDVNIIGIDRGERHLLYISVIDRNGHVLQDENGKWLQYSLNTINGSYKNQSGEDVSFETPYHKLLDKREGANKEARKNWGTIENIKELKSGYLSQVVHHIAALMVKYNAIVVMEDLNSGFKRGRFKVEKQVYQNFEKALIQKLNYLVFKDTPVGETGGLYHALQLADQFESFQKLTKQCGFIFYIPAWNTSKIDPVTGFTDLLKPKYTNIPTAQTFFGKFKSIAYDPTCDYFRFAFDYSDFTDKAAGSRTEWELCTQGQLRYTYNSSLNNNKGGTEKRDVTAHLKELFMRSGIDYASGCDLRDAICAQSNAGFYKALIKDLQVILAMRYSSAEDNEDFILSPVADENGNFYCSKGRTDGWPQDADANGAFNIARKGLWVLEQIDAAENYKAWSTKISNKAWLDYVQTRF